MKEEILKKRRYYKSLYCATDPVVAKAIDTLGSMKDIWMSDDPWITKEAILAMYLETPEGRAELTNHIGLLLPLRCGGLDYDHEGRRIR